MLCAPFTLNALSYIVCLCSRREAYSLLPNSYYLPPRLFYSFSRLLYAHILYAKQGKDCFNSMGCFKLGFCGRAVVLLEFSELHITCPVSQGQ